MNTYKLRGVTVLTAFCIGLEPPSIRYDGESRALRSNQLICLKVIRGLHRRTYTLIHIHTPREREREREKLEEREGERERGRKGKIEIVRGRQREIERQTRKHAGLSLKYCTQISLTNPRLNVVDCDMPGQEISVDEDGSQTLDGAYGISQPCSALPSLDKRNWSTVLVLLLVPILVVFLIPFSTMLPNMIPVPLPFSAPHPATNGDCVLNRSSDLDEFMDKCSIKMKYDLCYTGQCTTFYELKISGIG
ncbi:hypothetical protein EVAR_9815_1 [Eumeta japonica]|uniref:Uncharacterized protein n=1 Tax=Eumeta variegata TaxID=151549 RepID=A0A4C1U5T9_EUMVA|nr:hypothetical protein EVAR_9815_1 [Eumeta japonica]